MVKSAQREANPLLAQGIAVSEMAKQINVDRVMIYRWQKDEPFRAAATGS
jgi:transposase